MGDLKQNKQVLDACCGARMMWFNKHDPRAVFMDKRRERHELKDSSVKSGLRTLSIDPDFVGDFTSMPFADQTFSLVVLDPPHLVRAGKQSWMAKKYGKLGESWQKDMSMAFAECFRVLKLGGTLIFKWNETQIPVSQILELTDQQPLFGQRCGKQAKTHWLVFVKVEENSL